MDLPENKAITAAFLVLLAAFLSTLGFIGAKWPALSSYTRVSVAIAALSAIGTLFLAVATIWTVYQNR